jgi:putative ABC transport system permease protein
MPAALQPGAKIITYKNNAMFKNYFTVALRNLKRNTTFSVINIAGLAFGLAVFLLIMEFVAGEWSANRFQKNYDTLFRLATTDKNNNTGYYIAPGFAPAITTKIPGVQAVVRVADGIGDGVLTATGANGNSSTQKNFRENNVLYVEGNFLEVFSFPLADGSTSLATPQTMAISENMAMKLFGTVQAAGKTVTMSNQFGNTPYTVKGVFKNMPQTSDIQAQVLLSIHTLENAANRDDNNWADPSTTESGFTNIYVQLGSNANAAAVAGGITNTMHRINSNTAEQNAYLQPFSNLHLAPDFSYPYQTYGSLKLVVLLLSVAVLILIIAWVNYINLSTVQSFTRAKETGVRKVLGASRWQLSFQYLSETAIITIVAALMAIVLVQLLQPVFNGFAGKELSLAMLNQGWFWLAGVGFIIVGAILAGGYVSFVLSGYSPITAIRGKIANSVKGIVLRKGLVVFQFSISIIFIIATLILYQQLEYMKTSNLGINLQHLLVIKGPTVSSENQAALNMAFKDKLAQTPFISKFSASNNVPGVGYNFSAAGITKLNPQKGDDKKNYFMFISDEHFFDTYAINFSQGHSFTANEAATGWSNAGKVIINEKAAAQLGFAHNENIVGKKILWGKEYEIAGVVKDYHHLSMHQPIEPVIYLPSVSFVYFTIQTDGSNMQAKISSLESMYKTYFPGNPFEYFFADDTYNAQFSAEQQLGNLCIAAAVLAICIACMGLLGLAAFTAKQRIKEIGIRKVLGASVFSITQLLSKDFLQLVGIAAVIAFPLAWWAMYTWLQDFAYRISISWWVFAIAGATALCIALLTVSFQAIKAALANPVNSLRSE